MSARVDIILVIFKIPKWYGNIMSKFEEEKLLKLIEELLVPLTPDFTACYIAPHFVVDNKLSGTSLIDYLSYTTKIYQLVQRFSLVSVLILLYDREYRKLQSSMGYRWGTDIQHIIPCFSSLEINQLPKVAYPITVLGETQS